MEQLNDAIMKDIKRLEGRLDKSVFEQIDDHCKTDEILEAPLA